MIKNKLIKNCNVFSARLIEVKENNTIRPIVNKNIHRFFNKNKRLLKKYSGFNQLYETLNNQEYVSYFDKCFLNIKYSYEKATIGLLGGSDKEKAFILATDRIPSNLHSILKSIETSYNNKKKAKSKELPKRKKIWKIILIVFPILLGIAGILLIFDEIRDPVANYLFHQKPKTD